MIRSKRYVPSIVLLGAAAWGGAASKTARTQTTELLDQIESCETGDDAACNSAGVSLDGAERWSEAAFYFERACDGAEPLGCSNLGELYFDGRGVPRDQQEAARLFRSACDATAGSGCPGLCLVVLTSDAATPEPTASQCLELIENACNGGNSWMCRHSESLRARIEAPASPAASEPLPRGEGICDDQVARVLGRAYALSNPAKPVEQFRSFVGANAPSLSRDGAVVRCARALGSRLAESGHDAFDSTAYERAVESGMGPDAREVADSLNRSSVDLFAMGEELLWLADVLPATASGDFDPFLTTGTETRKQLQGAIALARQLESLSPEMSNLAGFTDALGQLFAPLAEEQIVMLARTLPR